jgi:hypothetical protein
VEAACELLHKALSRKRHGRGCDTHGDPSGRPVCGMCGHCRYRHACIFMQADLSIILSVPRYMASSGHVRSRLMRGHLVSGAHRVRCSDQGVRTLGITRELVAAERVASSQPSGTRPHARRPPVAGTAVLVNGTRGLHRMPHSPPAPATRARFRPGTDGNGCASRTPPLAHEFQTRDTGNRHGDRARAYRRGSLRTARACPDAV